MDYVGDDYVLLCDGDPPRAYAIYGTAKLDRRSLARLPALDRDVKPAASDEKALVDLAALLLERIRSELRSRRSLPRSSASIRTAG